MTIEEIVTEEATKAANASVKGGAETAEKPAEQTTGAENTEETGETKPADNAAGEGSMAGGETTQDASLRAVLRNFLAERRPQCGLPRPIRRQRFTDGRPG